jgi:hypothetical protein
MLETKGRICSFSHMTFSSFVLFYVVNNGWYRQIQNIISKMKYDQVRSTLSVLAVYELITQLFSLHLIDHTSRPPLFGSEFITCLFYLCASNKTSIILLFIAGVALYDFLQSTK